VEPTAPGLQAETNGIPIELEFASAREQEEYEGLFTVLRARGFEPRLARVPQWGSSEPAQALIVWVITRLPQGVASILAEVTAAWFRQRAAEEGGPAPQGTIQVMDPLSGRVFAKVPIIRPEPEPEATGWMKRAIRHRGMGERGTIALRSQGHRSPAT
jgi:hypothetical protein